ncbi:hypothetical protein EV175_001716 [Coemansia sp. RSA 1933]|nr:hypothetical protein EV175_001716 [Coemansia sp. RSA 1933]
MSVSQEARSFSESLGKSSSPTISMGRASSQMDKENEQEHGDNGTSPSLGGMDLGDEMGMDPDDSLMDSFLSSHSREFSDLLSQNIVDSPGGQSSVSQAISDSDFRVKKTLDATAADIRLLAGMSKTPDAPSKGRGGGGSLIEQSQTAPAARRVPEYMSPRQRAKLIESPLSNIAGVQSSPLRAPSSRGQAPKKAQLISSASSSFIAARSIFESQSQPQRKREEGPESPGSPPSPELGVQYAVDPMSKSFELTDPNYDSDHSQEMFGTSPRGPKAHAETTRNLNLAYSSSESEYPDPDEFLTTRSSSSAIKALNTSRKDGQPKKKGQSSQENGHRADSVVKEKEANSAGDTTTATRNIASRLRVTPQRAQKRVQIEDHPELVDPDQGAMVNDRESINNIEPSNEPVLLSQVVGRQSLGKRRRTQDSEPEYGNEAVAVLPSESSNEDADSSIESEDIPLERKQRANIQTAGMRSIRTPTSARRNIRVIPFSSPKRVKLSSESSHTRKPLTRSHSLLEGAASTASDILEKQRIYHSPTTHGLQKSQSLLNEADARGLADPVEESMGHELITPTTAAPRDSPRSYTEAEVEAELEKLGDAQDNGAGLADGDVENQSSDDTLPDANDIINKDADSRHARLETEDPDSSEAESVELEPETTTAKNSTAFKRQRNEQQLDEDEDEREDDDDDSDKETDKVPSDESDTEAKIIDSVMDDDSGAENWHPAAEALDSEDEWRPENSEIPNVPQQNRRAAETPSPLKPVQLQPVPATAAKITLPVSMLASTVKRGTRKIAAPKTAPAPDRQRRLSSSRPVSMCQRLMQLHELSKNKAEMDSGVQGLGLGLLGLVASNGASAVGHVADRQWEPPSPVRSATFSGAMRVYGEGAPELSDSERLQYMRRVKGLVEGTAMTAKEALRILYFFTGDWVGARKYIISGCAPPVASDADSCMWTAKDDEVLLQGMSSVTVEGLRQSKGSVEVYRRLQFLNTFHGHKG